MAFISNYGKTITIAFTVVEQDRLKERAGDDWNRQVATFAIEDGVGRFTLHADMFKGRKLGKMSSSGDRYMLILESKHFPLVPYFEKVEAELDWSSLDGKITGLILPKELPAINEKKRAALNNIKSKPVKAVKMVPMAIPQVRQKDSNLTLMIEGKSFRYEVPIEIRLRIMSDLATFVV